MKLSLPLKLGIAVVLLFAIVIATCLLWTPIKIRYYVGKLKSDNPKERVAGVDGLLRMGETGRSLLSKKVGLPREEIEFLSTYWNHINEPIANSHLKSFPIHVAITYGYKYASKLFMDKSEELDVRDINNWTPLHWAAQYGNNEITQMLIEKGAKINVKDFNNIMPLHCAITHGHTDIVKLLAENNATITGNVYNGETPLFLAIRYERVEPISILIRNGANANEKSSNGETPLDFAIKWRMRKMINLLRAHGGKTGEEIREQGNKGIKE